MFVIRRKRRWIDNSPCWVVFFTQKDLSAENPYDKILFDTFDEVLDWLRTSDATTVWHYYYN
jgi:hypothetical protein